MDQKLEVVVIPVSDAERAKEFYVRLGWRLDETPPTVVQLTPPGSGASVQFGPTLTAKGYLVVEDIEAAHDELAGAGAEATGIFHLGPEGPAPGPAPERRSYGSFVSFSDPDGNQWLVQEVTTRLPGRVDAAATTFASADDLARAMRRAEAAHGDHEKRTGVRDENWSDWYASYMVAEQAGTELPT